ncbi:MAG: DUF4149 domain-containing protein [Pseudomonadota bacterium]
MFQAVEQLMLAALLGGMVFFASIVAPVVFQALPADAAGRFLRRIFPRYYAYVAITSAAAAVLAWRIPWAAATLALISVTTLFVRQWLVPRINAWRDAELAGDTSAGKRFALGHRVSVLINLAQLSAVIAVVVLRA